MNNMPNPNNMHNPFTTPYCSMTAIDWLAVTGLFFAIYLVGFLFWCAYSNRKKYEDHG